ncbi:MAG: hypothetical protein AAB253_03510, partial [candidate division NC10 bacterium]
DDGLAGLLVAQDGAVALQGPDDQHLVNHATSCEFGISDVEFRIFKPGLRIIESNTSICGKEHARPWLS